MKKLIIIIAVALPLIFATGAFAQYDDLIKKVDKAWNVRTGNVVPIKESITMAEKAYGEKPGFDAAWRAARACFWVCDRTEDQKVDVEYGERGVNWARKAIKANANGVEGYYWLTLCLGEYGKGLGIINALRKGISGDFEGAAKKAISINGKYDSGGIYRALGRYYYSLPWPKYDAEQSEKNFKTSISIAPNFSRSHFYLAELYVKEKRYDDARKVLENLATLNGSGFEFKYFKNAGKDLYEKIKNMN